ncbi:MAG: hypothetical protein M1819_003896 [Sarea resinae]|nr:MAG: hypothetical protein M1819_003896 [Sarea resinae]
MAMSSLSFPVGLDLGGAQFSRHHVYIVAAACAVFTFVGFILVLTLFKPKIAADTGLLSFCQFFYASFLKPHEKNHNGSQEYALESFYKSQASAYDFTRKRLLRGREDMLGLVAAQLRLKSLNGTLKESRATWVDIGGGTGYNIEAMSAFLPVDSFFAHVYLVDLSPSLCDVARERFARLGWKNVTVVCQDARSFRLADHLPHGNEAEDIYPWDQSCLRNGSPVGGGADLITMSYSLSMIPDYYSVVDSLISLLSPGGTIGVVDFYVQSVVDIASRNYTGGAFNRHVNWLGRVFWRAWFDVDRVGLEAARRDYLEYKFGTIISASDRNYLLGGIPYYIFVGSPTRLASTVSGSASAPQDIIEKLDRAITESPYLSPTHHQKKLLNAVEVEGPAEIRSKAYECAIVNLASNLPLPSAFYQNHHWRIYYDDLLAKHVQFNNEYIYAFNWEDPRVDDRLLNIGSDDVILAITSAGDNVLDYLLRGPRRVHVVDLNPSQNHLLELKVASFTALEYIDVWKLFGEGKHANFREILISKLSPHMSSQALQYWLDHSSIFTSRNGKGLYESGGSRIAIKLCRYLFHCFGLTNEVRKLCEASTLNEQREIWPRIRKVLMSRPLHWAVVGTEWFLWKAAGVPPAQHRMIQNDYLSQEGVDGAAFSNAEKSGEAIWEYIVNTLDPVVENTLISKDNYFYLLCLQGHYSRGCHPNYLTPKAHLKLSRPSAFDGLRIHTDELKEVISRIAPGTLTIAVLMDSMDWFTPSAQTDHSSPAAEQVLALHHALKPGGRVLLRSAGLKPWYAAVFEAHGFVARRAGVRLPGACIDRVYSSVNMYASTWLFTKSMDPTSTFSVQGGSDEDMDEDTLRRNSSMKERRQRSRSSLSSVPESLEL